MNVKELAEIVTLIGIPLKNRDLHEVYLYATYERGSRNTSSKIASIVNLEVKNINMPAVATWLQKNMRKIQQLDPLTRRKD